MHNYRYDDLELHVVATPYEYYVDFDVYRLTLYDDGEGTPLKFINENIPTLDITKAERFLTGHIKWNCCSNFLFDDGDYLHSCTREELTRFGELFNRLFDLTLTLCPNCCVEGF